MLPLVVTEPHKSHSSAASLPDLRLRPLSGEKLSKITRVMDDESVLAVRRDIPRDDRVLRALGNLMNGHSTTLPGINAAVRDRFTEGQPRALQALHNLGDPLTPGRARFSGNPSISIEDAQAGYEIDPSNTRIGWEP